MKRKAGILAVAFLVVSQLAFAHRQHVHQYIVREGYGIFKKASAGWLKIYDDGSLWARIYGSSSNSIFAVGQGIYHFNGSDWWQYPQFQGYTNLFLDVWTDGNEVFVVTHNGSVTFVFHGK